jgi:hypothetical protein
MRLHAAAPRAAFKRRQTSSANADEGATCGARAVENITEFLFYIDVSCARGPGAAFQTRPHDHASASPRPISNAASRRTHTFRAAPMHLCRLPAVAAACAVLLLAVASSRAADDSWEEGQAGAPPSLFTPEKQLPSSCSRASSRTAKRIFAAYVEAVYGDAGGKQALPALLNASVLLGPNCPFGAGNGIFDDQEALKKQHR